MQVSIPFREQSLTLSYKLCLKNLRNTGIETRLNFCPKGAYANDHGILLVPVVPHKITKGVCQLPLRKRLENP